MRTQFTNRMPEPAALAASPAAVAPLYQTNSPEECEYVLRHSDAKVVFCENTAQMAKVEQVRSRCPALEHVVLLQGRRLGALSITQLIARGVDVPADEVDARV